MKSSPRTAAWISSSLLVIACVALPRTGHAQGKWAITQFTGRGVDAATLGTFHDLLRDQVQRRNDVTFVDVAVACNDAQCAKQAAAPTGAQTVVFGSVDALGKKLIVSVRSANVGSGQVEFSQSMSVSRVEELDVAAKRMADALVSGGSVEDNAELGTVTKEEARQPERRETRFALLLGMHGVAPQAGYGDLGIGAGFSVGAFVETSHFVIEPTLGYAFDLSSGLDRFEHVPLQVAMAYLLSQSDIAPMIGGGIGLAFLSETVHVSRSFGTVLVSTSKDIVDDDVFGLTAFPRVGVLLLRTYDVSVEVAVDYVFNFADFEERSVGHGLRFGVNLLLGGG